MTEAETKSRHSSPLCLLFLNTLLKHNCTSQREVPNSSVDLVQNWEKAKGNTDSQSSCLHLALQSSGSLEGTPGSCGQTNQQLTFCQSVAPAAADSGGQATLQLSSSTTTGQHCGTNSRSCLMSTSSALALLRPFHLRDTYSSP